MIYFYDINSINTNKGTNPNIVAPNTILKLNTNVNMK
jgi:hypothetical protein